jgi:hypothetical protein
MTQNNPMTLEEARKLMEETMKPVNSDFPKIPGQHQDEICKWIQRGDETEILHIVNQLIEASATLAREEIKIAIKKKKVMSCCFLCPTCEYRMMNFDEQTDFKFSEAQ